MLRFVFPAVLFGSLLPAQNISYPLESLKIEGSAVPRDTVLEIAGLRVGSPVNKERIEEACQKLGTSGIFQSVNYRYAPGPKHGFAVTLTVTDQTGLVAAAIDIPGSDEEKNWAWLISKYPAFDHRVPGADAAQSFLCKRIEEHAAADLHGEHLLARMDSSFVGGRPKSILSFQPEHLPRVTALKFSGNRVIPEKALVDLMTQAMAHEGYLDRTFRMYTELNLRQLYEQHGMYRVAFPSIVPQTAPDQSVAVTTTIVEGPQYMLGDVQLIGDSLPEKEMLAAADFKKGRLANWAEIDHDVRASEARLKKTGFMNAQANPQRVFDDENHILGLRIVYVKGPLFHFGQVKFEGLTPELEAKARKVWSAQPGEPYDFTYAAAFAAEFSKKADLRQFKKVSAKTQPGTGDHVVDLTVVFEPK